MEDEYTTRLKHNLEILNKRHLETELELWRLRREIADTHLIMIAGNRTRCVGCEQCCGSACAHDLRNPDHSEFREWAAEWSAAHSQMISIRFNLDVLAFYEQEKHAH